MKKSLLTKILIIISSLALIAALGISVIAGLQSNTSDAETVNTYQNNPFN